MPFYHFPFRAFNQKFDVRNKWIRFTIALPAAIFVVALPAIIYVSRLEETAFLGTTFVLLRQEY